MKRSNSGMREMISCGSSEIREVTKSNKTGKYIDKSKWLLTAKINDNNVLWFKVQGEFENNSI